MVDVSDPDHYHSGPGSLNDGSGARIRFELAWRPNIRAFRLLMCIYDLHGAGQFGRPPDRHGSINKCHMVVNSVYRAFNTLSSRNEHWFVARIGWCGVWVGSGIVEFARKGVAKEWQEK